MVMLTGSKQGISLHNGPKGAYGRPISKMSPSHSARTLLREPAGQSLRKLRPGVKDQRWRSMRPGGWSSGCATERPSGITRSKVRRSRKGHTQRSRTRIAASAWIGPGGGYGCYKYVKLSARAPVIVRRTPRKGPARLRRPAPFVPQETALARRHKDL